MPIAFFSRLLELFPAKKNVSEKALYIHAGTYKTGTTYFQHMCYHNKTTLYAHGIDYPELGLGLNTSHNRYAHRVLGLKLASGKSNGFPAIIDNLVKDPNLNASLVSYEGFAHPTNIEKLASIRSCFSGVDLHALLVFRPHIDFALSLYRELCQHVGFTAPFAELVQPTTAIGKYWNRTLNYRLIVEGWQQLVEEDSLHIHTYHKIKHDIAANLLATLGYRSALDTPTDQERNKTLSAPMAALMCRLNIEKFRVPMRHRLAHELSLLDRRFPEFSKFCEITLEEALAWEDSFQPDRTFLQQWVAGAEADLTIGSDWRWGQETAMADAVNEAHQALIGQLKEKQRPKMLEIATKSWKQCRS